MNDLAIESVETVILDVPMVRPHKVSNLTINTQPLLLVAVRTHLGEVGYGEGVVPGGPWWSGESVETMEQLVNRYMAPLMVGRSVADLAVIMQDIDRAVAAARFAKASVEIAMHDAWARCLGVPVHTLLGGAVRDSIDVTWALSAESADAVIEEAEQKLEEKRHFTFKVKMGADDPSADAERASRIARALRSRAGVRVDINGRWDRMTALRHLPGMIDSGIELVEQPTPAGQLDVLAELSDRLPVIIMGDESIHTAEHAAEAIKRRSVGVFSVKTNKCGGFRASRDVVTMARTAGIRCHAGSSIEGPVGTAASLQFACAEPGVDFGSELLGPLLMHGDLLDEPLQYRDGRLHLPPGPGLGITLNAAAVKKWARS